MRRGTPRGGRLGCVGGAALVQVPAPDEIVSRSSKWAHRSMPSDQKCAAQVPALQPCQLLVLPIMPNPSPQELYLLSFILLFFRKQLCREFCHSFAREF